MQWLLKNKRDLIDADYALNEGGWGESVNGIRLSNDVQVSEKYVINYRFEVRNKGGHSSLPVADNAIYHLAGALERLSQFGFPLKTNDVTRAYFRAMSGIEHGPVSGISRRGKRRHRGHAAYRRTIHPVERNPAHHVRRHDARGWPRGERPSPTGGRHGQLSRPA